MLMLSTGGPTYLAHFGSQAVLRTRRTLSTTPLRCSLANQTALKYVGPGASEIIESAET